MQNAKLEKISKKQYIHRRCTVFRYLLNCLQFGGTFLTTNKTFFPKNAWIDEFFNTRPMRPMFKDFPSSRKTNFACEFLPWNAVVTNCYFSHQRRNFLDDDQHSNSRDAVLSISWNSPSPHATGLCCWGKTIFCVIYWNKNNFLALLFL